jgi:putative inorganic carbon (HCO3(-)) transporter
VEAPKTVDDFYVFKVKSMWAYFKGQHFSFWMICAYLFFEFVRPQALFPVISVIPWAQLFLVGALLGALTDSSVKHVPTAANIYVALFLLLILISIPLAFRPEISMLFLMEFVSWVVVFFLITRIVNTKERFYIFLLIYLLAAGKIAIGTAKSWAGRGFSFADWGLMGPVGYFQNSGELAILMLMLFPLAFYLYQLLKYKIAWWERLLLLAFWVCPLLTILGASSRGAQVALAFQLTIMFRKSIFRFKALLGISILVAGLFFLLPEEQKQRFSSAGEDRTSQQRLLYWENGWDMMLDHPLTGVGFFNFISYFEAYYPEDMLYRTAQLPHNIFIQVGTDAGFIALFIFLLIILYCLRIPIKIYKDTRSDGPMKAIALGLCYGVLGYVIAGQFVTVAYYPFLWIHLAFVVCLNDLRNEKINPKTILLHKNGSSK